MAFNGNNIKFLQGSYDKLKTLTTSEVGAFYITNDTHEMFLGVDASKAPVALNRWVDVQADWAAVQAVSDYKQHPGKIYYAKNENILCTWNGEKWVQINPDTDTDTILTSVEISDGVVGADNKTITYTLTFNQADIDGNGKDAITASLVIDSDQITSLIVDVQVGVTAKAGEATNSAIIETVGAGSNQTNVVTVKGDGIVKVVATDGTVNLTGRKYDLSASGASVKLTDSDASEEDVVTFVGDTWIETKAGANANEIAINHKAPVGDGSDVTEKAATAVSIDAAAPKFVAVTGAKADANGHIISLETTEFTVPDSIYKLGVTEGDLEGSKYTTQVQLVDRAGSVVTDGSVDVKTAHKITVDGTSKVVGNGGDLGTFYSAGEIDRKFRTLDALTYKGVVNAQGDLPTSASLGDTYKVATAFGNYQVGDLLIANGASEDETGVISGAITWDHISTGDDTDTTYEIIGKDNQIVLKNLVSGSETDFIAVTDDSTYITATVNGDILNVSHKTITQDNTTGAANTLAYEEKFTAVTGVARDGAGHVTGIETTEFTMPKEDVVTLNAETPSFAVSNDGTDKGTIAFADSEKILVSGAVEGKVLTVTAEHAKLAAAPADKNEGVDVAVKLDGTSTFTVLDNVVVDEYGHVTGFNTKDISVAKETTYTLTGPAMDNDNVKYVFADNSGKESYITLTSETLKYAVADGAAKIDLVWGSF